MRPRSCFPVLLVLIAGLASAQVTVNDPNFEVTTVASGIAANGASLAADRLGNVYILNQTNATAANGTTSITRVRPDGTVDPTYATNLPLVGQLATNQSNGAVYMVTRSPVLTVILSTITRLDPTGPTGSFDVNVVADGFATDYFGRFYLGGTGAQGPGVYRCAAPFSSSVNPCTFLTPGFGANALLQVMVNLDLLIADGAQVRRWTPGAIGTVPYGTFFALPNTISNVESMAVMPFNQLGGGALIGVNTFSTFSFSSVGRAFVGDFTSGSNTVFAMENVMPASGRFRGLCHGYRQTAYWLADDAPASGTTSPTRRLDRIRQLPAPGSAGSLIVSQAPGTLTLDLWGRIGEPSPFLMGARIATAVPRDVFFPVIGWVDVSPGDPLYQPLFDGVGFYGPANPLARCGADGHFSASFAIPPFLPTLPIFEVQALTIDVFTPNGFFAISNVDTISIP